MILTCPACSTRFLVPDAAFAGRAFRRVRCGRCKHEWQAEAPAAPDFASLIAEPAPQLTPPVAIAPQPIPAGSNLPAKIRRRWLGRLTPRRSAALLVLLLLLLLAAIAGLAPAGLAWLQPLVEKISHANHAPALVIENVTTRYLPLTAAAAESSALVPDAAADAGGATPPAGWSLIVEGTIRNQTDAEEIVPPLRLFTKDAGGAQLGIYHPSVQMQTLPPHGQTGFSMQLGAADPKLAEVTVEFSDGSSGGFGDTPDSHSGETHAAE